MQAGATPLTKAVMLELCGAIPISTACARNCTRAWTLDVTVFFFSAPSGNLTEPRLFPRQPAECRAAPLPDLSSVLQGR
jgi:hypothetical protein